MLWSSRRRRSLSASLALPTLSLRAGGDDMVPVREGGTIEAAGAGALFFMRRKRSAERKRRCVCRRAGGAGGAAGGGQRSRGFMAQPPCGTAARKALAAEERSCRDRLAQGAVSALRRAGMGGVSLCIRGVVVPSPATVATFGPLDFFPLLGEWPPAWAEHSMVELPPHVAHRLGLAEDCKWLAAPRAQTARECRAAGFLGPSANHGSPRERNAKLEFLWLDDGSLTVAVVLTRPVDATKGAQDIFVDYGLHFGSHLRALIAAREARKAAARARGPIAPRAKPYTSTCSHCGAVYRQRYNFHHIKRKCGFK